MSRSAGETRAKNIGYLNRTERLFVGLCYVRYVKAVKFLNCAVILLDTLHYCCDHYQSDQTVEVVIASVFLAL